MMVSGKWGGVGALVWGFWSNPSRLRLCTKHLLPPITGSPLTIWIFVKVLNEDNDTYVWPTARRGLVEVCYDLHVRRGSSPTQITFWAE